MKNVEDVLVFYKSQPNYNPQGLRKLNVVKSNHKTKSVNSGVGLSAHNGGRLSGEYVQEFTNYPAQVLDYPNTKGLHPTQKPVALFEYLIKTYSNEGDLVLDNCIGSGTTAVACVNTKRNFIGMELSPEYCDIANKRLNQEVLQ
jgi:site-specific DNA-methyltransferase (adenine-specific)